MDVINVNYASRGGIERDVTEATEAARAGPHVGPGASLYGSLRRSHADPSSSEGLSGRQAATAGGRKRSRSPASGADNDGHSPPAAATRRTEAPPYSNARPMPLPLLTSEVVGDWGGVRRPFLYDARLARAIGVVGPGAGFGSGRPGPMRLAGLYSWLDGGQSQRAATAHEVTATSPSSSSSPALTERYGRVCDALSPTLGRSALLLERNVQRYAIARELEGHTGCVNSIHMDDAGRYLLTGSDDCAVCLFSVADDWRRVWRFNTAHTRNIFSAVFLSGGPRSVLSCALDGRTVWSDVETGSYRELIRERRLASSIAVAPHWHDVAYVAYDSGDLYAVDVRRRAPERVGTPLPGLTREVNTLATHPAYPSLLLSGTDHSFVFIHDVRMLGLRAVAALQVLPDRGRVREVGGLSFSQRGDWLAVNYRSEEVYLVPWEAALRGAATDFSAADDFPTPPPRIPTPSIPLVDCTRNHTRLIGRDNEQTMFKEVAFLENDAVVCTGSDDGNVYFWRTRDGTPLHRTPGDRGIVNGVLYHPRAGCLVTCGLDSTVKLLATTRDRQCSGSGASASRECLELHGRPVAFREGRRTNAAAAGVSASAPGAAGAEDAEWERERRLYREGEGELPPPQEEDDGGEEEEEGEPDERDPALIQADEDGWESLPDEEEEEEEEQEGEGEERGPPLTPPSRTSGIVLLNLDSSDDQVSDDGDNNNNNTGNTTEGEAAADEADDEGETRGAPHRGGRLPSVQRSASDTDADAQRRAAAPQKASASLFRVSPDDYAAHHERLVAWTNHLLGSLEPYLARCEAEPTSELAWQQLLHVTGTLFRGALSWRDYGPGTALGADDEDEEFEDIDDDEDEEFEDVEDSDDAAEERELLEEELEESEEEEEEEEEEAADDTESEPVSSSESLEEVEMEGENESAPSTSASLSQEEQAEGEGSESDAPAEEDEEDEEGAETGVVQHGSRRLVMEESEEDGEEDAREATAEGETGETGEIGSIEVAPGLRIVFENVRSESDGAEEGEAEAEAEAEAENQEPEEELAEGEADEDVADDYFSLQSLQERERRERLIEQLLAQGAFRSLGIPAAALRGFSRRPTPRTVLRESTRAYARLRHFVRRLLRLAVAIAAEWKRPVPVSTAAEGEHSTASAPPQSAQEGKPEEEEVVEARVLRLGWSTFRPLPTVPAAAREAPEFKTNYWMVNTAFHLANTLLCRCADLCSLEPRSVRRYWRLRAHCLFGLTCLLLTADRRHEAAFLWSTAIHSPEMARMDAFLARDLEDVYGPGSTAADAARTKGDENSESGEDASETEEEDVEELPPAAPVSATSAAAADDSDGTSRTRVDRTLWRPVPALVHPNVLSSDGTGSVWVRLSLVLPAVLLRLLVADAAERRSASRSTTASPAQHPASPPLDSTAHASASLVPGIALPPASLSAEAQAGAPTAATGARGPISPDVTPTVAPTTVPASPVPAAAGARSTASGSPLSPGLAASASQRAHSAASGPASLDMVRLLSHRVESRLRVPAEEELPHIRALRGDAETLLQQVKALLRR